MSQTEKESLLHPRGKLSHEEAILHADRKRNRRGDGTLYPFTSGIEELGKISIGVSLYFHYLVKCSEITSNKKIWSAAFYLGVFFLSLATLVRYINGKEYSASNLVLTTWQGNTDFYDMRNLYLGINFAVLFIWILFTTILGYETCEYSPLQLEAK